MEPVRLKTEVATDLEGIRAAFMRLGPQLEKRQPGITAQFAGADFSQPLHMAGPGGNMTVIRFDPQGAVTVIRVEARPPAKPMGRLRQGWWRWRTRLALRMALKAVRKTLGAPVAVPPPPAPGEAITPEVMPPER